MNAVDWRIPPSVTKWLTKSPVDASVALLLRHSVRGPLPPGAAGNAVPITADGVKLAQELGALAGSSLLSLQTSPLLRCMQTAEAIRAGAASDVPVVPNRLLGDPSVYVMDDVQADLNWRMLGHEDVMAHLVSQNHPLPGMADPDTAARFLARHMLTTAGDPPGLHVFVTHDSVVTVTAARLLGKPLGRDDWPSYLEGAFFWRQLGQVVVAYRDHCHRIEADTLTQLGEGSATNTTHCEVVELTALAS